MLLHSIRQSFLDFFQKHDHKILPSSSTIPHNDPSILFTNAGMVQFKNQFTGKEDIRYPRIATSQKCIRAGGKHNDLENIGFTSRHHTFFEMMGNFSFGNYFKEEAILYAWKYLTKELQINKSKIYITTYDQDDESYVLWKKITSFSDDKIIKIKTSDNFWSMGDIGPCGPCSEIFYDHGEQYFGGIPGSKDENGDRYVEIWNLVFMEYEKLSSEKQIKLPNPSIDTGMGLERISAVMQGVNSNYDIDIFKVLIEAIISITNNTTQIISNKIIADHIRSSCLLIADGILPSNEGRGYVLRRIMRRAMRQAYNIGYHGNLLSKIAPVFIDSMKAVYPDMKDAHSLITCTLDMEEDRFKHTLVKGMKYLDKMIDYLPKNGTLDGSQAFQLYDTYGFPLDLTTDILKEKNLKIDNKGFEIAMREQKIRAKNNWSGNGEKEISLLWHNLYRKFGNSDFIRDERDSLIVIIQAIIINDQLVTSANQGDQAIIITNQTIFYAESGGQVGDKGRINNSAIYDTKLLVEKIHGHYTILSDTLKVGDEVRLSVNYQLRNKIRANHSATHLLHFALRNHLGKHVVQKGSLVNDKKLRFDFTHNKSVTKEELYQIEQSVNNIIILNKKTNTHLTNLKDAKENGTIALFGEKYDDQVRVVTIDNSIELCGGTHVYYTGDIGLFAILSEESISTGIRRIEALTGIRALNYLREKAIQHSDILQILKCKEKDVVQNIVNLQNKIKSITKINEQYRNKLLINTVKEINTSNAKILLLVLKEKNICLKSIYNNLKNNKESIIVVINTDMINNRTLLLVGLSEDFSTKYSAKDLIQRCYDTIDGTGGGNHYFAQASGKNINVEEKIINTIKNIL